MARLGPFTTVGLALSWLPACSSTTKTVAIPVDGGGTGGDSSGAGGVAGTATSGAGGAGAGGASAGAAGAGGTGGSSGSGGAGAGGTGGSGSFQGVIGEPCANMAECAALGLPDDGDSYCSQGETCRRFCSMHADCGCPVGTTDADVATGACQAGCFDLSIGPVICYRACDAQGDCEGSFETCAPFSAPGAQVSICQ
jgi:hypothetical protein